MTIQQDIHKALDSIMPDSGMDVRVAYIPDRDAVTVEFLCTVRSRVVAPTSSFIHGEPLNAIVQILLNELFKGFADLQAKVQWVPKD